LRKLLVVIGLSVPLAGCVSVDHFFQDTVWPFGNPNAPKPASETAQRALGHSPQVAVIATQPGDVWPGPVQPMPTLNDIQAHANLPLGQGYTPSLPSPYPPGQDPYANKPLITMPPAPPSDAPASGQ
jgi:hypothetical protein